MAAEIKVQALGSTGTTCYFVVYRSDGAVWNTAGTPAFETFNAANWADYATALVEQGVSGLFVGTFPAGISTAGTYAVVARQRAGGAPAVGDTAIGDGEVEWTGTAIVPLGDVWKWRGTAVATPGTAGVPSVDALRIGTTVQDTGKNITRLVGYMAASWVARVSVPAVIEVPASGTRTYRAEIIITGTANGENLDDASGPGVPVVALINQAGTSVASRLGTVTRISVGRYRVIYTSTAGDADAGLIWSVTTTYGGYTQISEAASIVQAERAAIPTAAVNASTLLATELYTGWSITRGLKKMLSMLVGKTSGLTSGAGTYVVKDPTDAATEETFTVTADGNRTSSTHA